MRRQAIGIEVEYIAPWIGDEPWLSSEQECRKRLEIEQQTRRQQCRKGAACCLVLSLDNYSVQKGKQYDGVTVIASTKCTADDCPDMPSHPMQSLSGVFGNPFCWFEVKSRIYKDEPSAEPPA